MIPLFVNKMPLQIYTFIPMVVKFKDFLLINDVIILSKMLIAEFILHVGKEVVV